MAQFGVYENSASKSKASVPYLLDVQSDLLDSLATRVVVPLYRLSKAHQPISRLNPVFEVDGTKVLLSTAELAGVPSSALGPGVTSLEDHRVEIVNALDFLLTGI